MSNVFRCIHVSSFIANVCGQDWKEAALFLIMNPTLSFRIVIQYDGVHNGITNLLPVHTFSQLIWIIWVFQWYFFLTINSISISFLLVSFQLDKRIFSHCNDSIFKQHTYIHEYRTCHILYQCINKRAGSLINSINEYTIIYKSMTVFQPIASAFFCLSVCQFALNSWITSGRLMWTLKSADNNVSINFQKVCRKMHLLHFWMYEFHRVFSSFGNKRNQLCFILTL